MQVEAALAGVSRLFLDTAPVIYFVERNPQFVAIVDPIFSRLDNNITAVASPVTLAECLVGPLRLGLVDLEQAFIDVILGENAVFIPIDEEIARDAARIRVCYNLQLPDALQIAVALTTECEAFLTNDTALQRVSELRILLLEDLDV